MLKKFVISLIVLICFGCSKSISLNIDEVSSKIINKLNLSDSVSKLDLSDIENLLYLDNGTLKDGVMYISNTNKADIVGIIETDKTNDIKKIIEEYVELLKEQNSNYFPSEVEKLNNAFIKVSGNYVILVVCDDFDSIKNIVDEVVK